MLSGRLKRNFNTDCAIMSHRFSLNANPYILPAFSPSTRKHVGDRSMTYNACGDEIIQFTLAWVSAENWISFGIFVTDRYALVKRRASIFCSWMRLSPTRLFPVNDYESGIDTLSHRISSRPVVCKTDSATCQQNEDQRNSHLCSIPSFSSRSE